MKYIDIALKAWRDGDELRRRRIRYKDYTYGRQWNDLTTDAEGHTVTEGELASRSGSRPHCNNLIRQLVKCVIGNFRATLAEADPAAESAPVADEVSSRNLLTELDCRMLEEFLISGCAIQRVCTEKRLAGSGVWVDNVSPAEFFINRFTDPRGLDIELVGMLRSMSMRELLMRFAPGGGARAQELTRIYSDSGADAPAALGDSVAQTFFRAETGRCRVIEIWTLEQRSVIRCHDTASGDYFLSPASERKSVATESERRSREGEPELRTCMASTLRWHCRYMAPSGEILDEFDSPYPHGMHPFAVKFYPLIDGEVHSLVEDIIDQQRSVNRLITLIDNIMSVSAKGTLLVPADSLVPGMTIQEVGRRWARCDSVIPYRPAKGEMRQIVSSGENAGAYQLLDMQMRLFSQISGVSDALQGRPAVSNPSAALFDAQVRHSAVAILDLIDTFHSFRAARNRIINSTYIS